MDTNSDLQLLARPVAYLEHLHPGEEVQRHVGDLAHVTYAVLVGQPAGHHVSIADRLNLKINPYKAEIIIINYWRPKGFFNS